jgi:hypothetical protein
VRGGLLAFQFGCNGGAELAPALLEFGQTVVFQVLVQLIETLTNATCSPSRLI